MRLPGYAVLTWFAFTAVTAAQDVQVDVRANRNQIYIGESVILTVKVSGIRDAQRPDLSQTKDVEVTFLDSQDQHFSQFSWNGHGRPKKTETHSRTFTFRLKPTKAGRLRAGPVRVRVGGRTITKPGPVIDVRGIEKQDLVAISITPSRDTILVDEPFDITLKVRIQRPDAAKISPLHPGEPPLLEIPYLDQKEIEGLVTPDIQQILQSRLRARGNDTGFAINNYTVRSDPFDMNSVFDFNSFMDRKKAKFDFDARPLVEDGQAFIEYSLGLGYTPKEEGSYTFGPVIFKGPVITGTDAQGMRLGRRIFAVGPACTVRVVPPPEEGRPASYIGAIGTNLQVTAKLDAQTCNVGDPLTLTLTVSGDISLENLRQPNLAAQEDLTRIFRIYDDNVQVKTLDHAKEYAYVIRPSTGGTLEVPPLQVAYYDTATRSYRTVRTEPIPLRAREITQMGDDIVISAATNAPLSGVKLRAGGRLVPGPLDLSPDGVQTEAVRLQAWQLVVLAAGPMSLLVLVLTRRGLTLAAKRAQSRLKRNVYRSLLHALTGDTDMADIWAAARAYFANRLDAYGEALTPGEIGSALRRRGVTDADARELEHMLGVCFNAAFASSKHQGATELDRRRLRALIDLIEQHLRPHRPARRATIPTLLAFLLALASAHAGQYSHLSERWFLWDAANARMTRAQTQSEYLAAADLYQQLADRGARNAHLHYNMGTALLLAEKYDAAVRELLRAERYAGADADIRRNLLLALRGRQGDDETGLPWYRSIFFWHYGLPASVRISIAVVAFSCLWLAWILRVIGLRRCGHMLARLAAAILVVFAASAGLSWHEEVRTESTRHLETLMPAADEDAAPGLPTPATSREEPAS